MVERREFDSLWTEIESDSRSLRIYSLCSRGGARDSPPVVFVPGLGASGLSVLPTAELLRGERDVLVVDLPGQGKSERPRGVLDLRVHAAILAAWLEALGFGFERGVWVGHSFGSQVLVE